MPENAQTAAPKRYKLKASYGLLAFEIALHLLLAACVLGVSTSPWNFVFLFLLALLAIRFFRRDSVIRQYDADSALEINPADLHLAWINRTGTRNFPADQVKIRITRWFILLQLGHGCSHFQRLLVRGSFENPKLYSECRRILKRAEHAGGL